MSSAPQPHLPASRAAASAAPRPVTLWSRLTGFRRYYAVALVALILATFLAYLIPLVTRYTIDSIVDHVTPPTAADSEVAPAAGGSAGDSRPLFTLLQIGSTATDGDSVDLAGRLWRSALAIGLLAVASGGLMYLKGHWSALGSEGIIQQLRNRLYDHLQRMPCRYHDRAETGDLVQRCTSDIETLRHFLSVQVAEIGRGLLLLAVVIPIMLLLDVRMTLVSLAGTPLILAFGVGFFLKIKPAFLEMDEAEGRMTTTLQENLTGIRVVRAFARQEFECGKFAESNGQYRDRHYGLIQLLAIYWPLSDILVFGQQATVLLVGATWVAQGRLTIGTLVAFLLFVNIFIWPVRQLGRILTDLGKALVAWGRIAEVLSEPDEDDDEPSPAALPAPASDDKDEPPCRGEIRFDHVTFAYTDGHPVLHDLSFHVEPGQTLAIVGHSGAGKSTLVNLLLRFYDGFDGSITLDGHPLEQLDRRWLRSQISVVMQEPFLYSKTVRDNIRLGRHDAEEQELFEAAHSAVIHDTILGFDQGYETMVGERGVTLSGGQRQRLALARALLQRPGILILDDALSAVDTETETLILRALCERHGRQTTLVIAHRISTLRHADRVLVIDDGRLQHLDTHERLTQRDGIYRKLWEIQSSVTVDQS